MNQSHTTTKKYLIFRLNDNLFGIGLADVKEVISKPDIVPIPGAPLFCEGMLNLRGQVITAIDLKKKFNMPLKSDDSDLKYKTIILIQEQQNSLGYIVDRVTEVCSIPDSKIELTQTETNSWGGAPFKVAKLEGHPLIAIVDLKQISVPKNIIPAAEVA